MTEALTLPSSDIRNKKLMNWSEQAWKSIDPILDEIRQHPFITEMADGTLSPAKFAKYLAQDKLYLANYGREMKALAAMLPYG